jgi:hypothetical protein
MESLRIMQSHGCAVGYPAHGAVIGNLPRKIEGELMSKTKREERVLRTLADIKTACGRAGKGSVTVTQLVTAIYGRELDDQVRTMAIEPFLEEVLRKLAEDGKVAFEVKGGEKKWFIIQTDD